MIVEELHAIFAQPVPVLGLVLSRIALGTVLAYDGVRRLREYEVWYGADALRPAGPALPRAVLWVQMGSAVLFACGVATPVAGVVLLACLVAAIVRNPYIAYGGDVFACAVLLLLICAPSGGGSEASPWGGQLLRVEVALLYFTNFIAKVRSPAWRRGTVMFDLLHDRNFARAGIPRWIARRDVARFATWGALAAELAFGPALLYPPTAAVACVAAIAFHLVIARLVDVHLFSAVMIAALLACWPVGQGTLPAPPLDAAQAGALALALAYLAWALACDLTPLRCALRGWQMFTASPPSVIRVEITIVDRRGEVACWAWEHVEDLWDRRPAHAPHRLVRFQFALLGDAHARRRLRDRFAASLAGRDVRAWSIDAVLLGIHDERILGGVNIGAQLAMAEGAVEHAACRALATAVRCPATRATLDQLAAVPA